MPYFPTSRLLTSHALVVLLVLLLSASSFVGCECVRQKGGTQEPIGKPGTSQIPPPNSVNLLLSAPIDDDTIKNRIMASFNPAEFTPADIIVRRCHCDSALINVALPSSYTIILKGSEGPLVVKSGSGAAGGDVDLPLSGKGDNFMLSTLVVEKEYSTEQGISRQINTDKYNVGTPVSIAVFDTGLDETYLAGSSWKQTLDQCAVDGTPSPTGSFGWNFTADGNETKPDDTSPIHHGSRVANLIARQFNGGTITPRIIPMKVLSGASNQGDLFGLLCAMETARKNKIRVFNMSLGYYGGRDSLFEAYVKRAITDNVVLVTAAGNRPNATVDRNFNTMDPKFYPAGFNATFDKVIAVTTVSLRGTTPTSDTLVSCPLQNYGPSNVVGVLQSNNCRFEFAPSGTPTALIEGSSYATPILAGWLARKMGQNPAQIGGWSTLPVLLNKARHGNELYKNAYLRPEPRITL